MARTYITIAIVFAIFLVLALLSSEWGAGELADQTERYIQLNS